jgi:hypothetical protein
VRRLVWLLAGGLFLACAASRGGWDVAALEVAQPALAEHRGHRLGDALPYWMPDEDRGGLVLFLCRWSQPRSLRVSLPPDATPTELETIRLALRAWQGAELGVRFEEAESGPADIEVRFARVPEQPIRTAVGDTIADCGLVSGGGADRDLVPARLVFASILLHRVLFDVAGRPVDVGRDELLGATLHELGHALGYPGHVPSRDSVMTTASGEVARIGRRVLAGKPLRDATLAALYALPSGVVVGRLEVEAAALEAFYGLAPRALRRGLRGPYVRVGEAATRLLWRRADGAAAGSLVVHDWRAALEDSARFELHATARAQALLDAN